MIYEMIHDICNCCHKPFSYRKKDFKRREYPYTCTYCIRHYCNRPNPNEKHLMTSYKHGEALVGRKTRVYRLFSTMHERCYKPNSKSFKYYGAKGLSVCLRWHCFKTYKKDIEAMGYTEGDTILRVDKKKGYDPSNITVHKGKVTGNVYLYCGKYLSLNQLVAISTNGISRIGLKKRLMKNPSAETAIHKALSKRNPSFKV